MIDMTFVEGKQIRHKYTKEPLWILKEGREQILCRTKDLREIWFYSYELEELPTCGISESTHKVSRFL